MSARYYPVTFDGHQTDTRYSVQKEWCGHSEPRFVARFCGQWVGQSRFYPAAVLLAVGHKCQRNGSPVIICQP